MRWTEMPLPIVGGPVVKDDEKKRNLIVALTEAASDIYELPCDAITALIEENPPENVGVGGEPLTETYQENPIALGRQRWRRIVSC